jgi:glycosyltransferase involved in cell wall biosynthesis
MGEAIEGAPVHPRVTHPPRVVACVPAWNAESFIDATLEALAAQTYPNLEVLISDDASTDGTMAICERFAALDARFRVIRQRANRGWIGNVNALLRAAKGDYLLFAFHDDLLRPTYVERLVEKLEANPRAILAFSDIEALYVDGRREIRVYDKLDGVERSFDRARQVLRQRPHWSTPHRGVFRSRAAARIGGLKRHLAGERSADWPWLLNLSLLGEFVRVPEILCCKVYQPNSLSRSWSFSYRSWLAVALSCAAVIRRSDLSRTEKVSLYALLADCAARRLWALRHRRR